MDKCKYCKKEIHFNIKKCPHCGKAWPSSVKSPSFSKTGTEEAELHVKIVAAVFMLAIVAGIYYLFIYESPEDKLKAAAEAAESAQRKAQEREKGWHCLSGWDGSHRDTVQMTKQGLKDPDSFEHTETRLGPKDERGYHLLIMKYRARNGFGGMTVGAVRGSLNNASCQVSQVQHVE